MGSYTVRGAFGGEKRCKRKADHRRKVELFNSQTLLRGLTVFRRAHALPEFSLAKYPAQRVVSIWLAMGNCAMLGQLGHRMAG